MDEVSIIECSTCALERGKIVCTKKCEYVDMKFGRKVKDHFEKRLVRVTVWWAGIEAKVLTASCMYQYSKFMSQSCNTAANRFLW